MLAFAVALIPSLRYLAWDCFTKLTGFPYNECSDAHILVYSSFKDYQGVHIEI